MLVKVNVVRFFKIWLLYTLIVSSRAPAGLRCNMVLMITISRCTVLSIGKPLTFPQANRNEWTQHWTCFGEREDDKQPSTHIKLCLCCGL